MDKMKRERERERERERKKERKRERVGGGGETGRRIDWQTNRQRGTRRAFLCSRLRLGQW